MGLFKRRVDPGDAVFEWARALAAGDEQLSDHLLESKIADIPAQEVFVAMVALAEAVSSRLTPEQKTAAELTVAANKMPDELSPIVRPLARVLIYRREDEDASQVMAEQFQIAKKREKLWIASVKLIMILSDLSRQFDLQFA